MMLDIGCNGSFKAVNLDNGIPYRIVIIDAYVGKVKQVFLLGCLIKWSSGISFCQNEELTAMIFAPFSLASMAASMVAGLIPMLWEDYQHFILFNPEIF